MSSNNTSNAALLAIFAMRIAGLQKYGPALGPNIPINGQSFTVEQLLAIYQACVADRGLVGSARGALGVLLAQQEKDDAARKAVDQGIKVAVVAKYGATSQQASDFGFGRQPKKPTVKVKADAVDQAANTRVLRHTMGKKQRGSIKATVPAPVAPPPAPVTAQAAPGTTPTK